MNTEKQSRRPIIDPLLLALKSRRVLIALVTLFVGTLVTAIPALQPFHAELLTLLGALALALIGGYSVEDAAGAIRSKGTPTEGPPPNMETLIREALASVIGELRGEPGPPPDPQDE